MRSGQEELIRGQRKPEGSSVSRDVSRIGITLALVASIFLAGLPNAYAVDQYQDSATWRPADTGTIDCNGQVCQIEIHQTDTMPGCEREIITHVQTGTVLNEKEPSFCSVTVAAELRQVAKENRKPCSIKPFDPATDTLLSPPHVDFDSGVTNSFDGSFDFLFGKTDFTPTEVSTFDIKWITKGTITMDFMGNIPHFLGSAGVGTIDTTFSVDFSENPLKSDCVGSGRVGPVVSTQGTDPGTGVITTTQSVT